VIEVDESDNVGAPVSAGAPLNSENDDRGCGVTLQREAKVSGLVVLLVLSALLLLPAGSGAQVIEARLYANVPVGTHFGGGTYRYSRGEIMVNNTIVEDSRGDIHLAMAGYLYTFDLAGMTAKFDAGLPYVWINASALLEGDPASGNCNGLADPKFRLTLSFLGAPALGPQEFAGYRQKTIVGASLQVIPPWGKYDPNRLLNTGANRWTFRPEIGVSHAIKQWILECYASAFLFTENREFFGGTTLTQNHVGIFQFHAIYRFKPRFWAGLNWIYTSGGESRIDGEFRHDFVANNRVGATLAIPIEKHHNVKFIWSSGVTTRVGGDFDNFMLVYLYNW